jgi:hypothetical protein
MMRTRERLGVVVDGIWAPIPLDETAIQVCRVG